MLFISNEAMEMRIPKEVRTILKMIEEKGEEAYIVGGCVRDVFLKREPHDWDITTSMLPEDVIKLFQKRFLVVPTGIKYGTVKVLMEEGEYEITTYRTEGKYLDSRHPETVSFVKNIEKDLARRDFSMNAIAFSLSNGFADPFNGRESIENGIICAVNDARERFEEDALRMMRAIRFSAQFQFAIANETYMAICEKADNINRISKERIRDELCKILLSPQPSHIELLYFSGLLKNFLPEVDACFKTTQNHPWHCYRTVGYHTTSALMEAVEANTEFCSVTVMMAILLHDIGKARTKTTDDAGIDHFHGHAEVSAQLSRKIMKRLRFSREETEEVFKLILAHDAPIETNKKAIRRYIKKYGLYNKELFFRSLFVKYADNAAQNREFSGQRISELKEIANMYDEICDVPVSAKDLAINGYDVMNKGYKGEEVGKILSELVDFIVENPEKNQREILLDKICEK